MQNILITGISGFAGSHLAESLVLKKYQNIYGTYLIDSSLDNLSHIKSDISLFRLNLLSKKDVFGLISKIKPKFIFHLAALTSPAKSFDNPEDTIINNVVAQLNLFEAVKNAKLQKCRILIASSADVYGKVLEDELPIDENTKFTPTNPYAVSKITQDFLALQYFLSYNLQIIRARPFNHIGPKQSPNFVVAAFCKSIAEIEKGKKENILNVGNLETRRDFTDVRDVAAAYQLIIEKGKIGDAYNIGSGVSYEIADILNKLISLSKIKIKVEKEPSLFRPTDTQNLVCNFGKIRKELNWSPKISIDQSLKDTLDYWRDIV